MDTDRFADALRRWSTARRPLLGAGLGSLLGLADLMAGDARKKRKKKRNKKSNPRPCVPDPSATTCAGRCGSVRDNCGTTVDCGTAATCQASGFGNLCCEGTCATGTCCDSSACSNPTPVCVNHTCTQCSDSVPCPTGTCCTGDGTCGDCLVFVTAQSPTGNIGGLAGADAICQGEADAAGLPGTYMAWLSDATGSPSTRFTRAKSWYFQPNGFAIAHGWAGLTDQSAQSLSNPISYTATGVNASDTRTWTGNQYDGTPSRNSATRNCLNWTSASPDERGYLGNPAAVYGWSEVGFSETCDTEHRLYCFQQR